MNHQHYMRKTFTLAQKALGSTWPNPLVGAILVKGDEILGTGYHDRKGNPHAEVNAIENALKNHSPQKIQGSTLYVNLEPCCHFNKTTPPCAQRVIADGISRVVISNLDPNPMVNGQGCELLKKNGIEVITGILKDEGERLNEVFYTSQRKKRPFFHLKTACTLDGKISLNNGESQWITGEEARYYVHQMRSQHQAILIGGETLRSDNPRLTIRLDHKVYSPWRIVLSQSGDFSHHAHLFSDEWRDKTLVYLQKNQQDEKKKIHQFLNASQIISFQKIEEVFKDLMSKNIINVLLETGPRLHSFFLEHGYIDRLTLFQNPSFIGEGKDMFSLSPLQSLDQRYFLKDVTYQKVGNDFMLSGIPQYQKRHICLQD